MREMKVLMNLAEILRNCLIKPHRSFWLRLELRTFSFNELYSFQLKLQPQVSYAETIAKTREFQLIFRRSGNTHSLSTVRKEEKSCLDRMKQSLQ